jgi:uncharacterized protein YndB with AHSA1/START domain
MKGVNLRTAFRRQRDVKPALYGSAAGLDPERRLASPAKSSSLSERFLYQGQPKRREGRLVERLAAVVIADGETHVIKHHRLLRQRLVVVILSRANARMAQAAGNLVDIVRRGEGQMIEFTIERKIARSPAEVFAFVVDATKLATWQTNIVSAVPDGPMQLGTKIREVHRAPGGKQIATVVEVVEYEPERAFGLRVIEGLPVHGQMTFERSDAGTRFRFRVYSQPTGMLRLNRS